MVYVIRPDPARKLYDIYLLLCVQWKTPDDGQRSCPKHVEFYSKNKFQKLVHLVGFIVRIYHDARSPERQKSLIYESCRIKLGYNNWFQNTSKLYFFIKYWNCTVNWTSSFSNGIVFHVVIVSFCKMISSVLSLIHYRLLPVTQFLDMLCFTRSSVRPRLKCDGAHTEKKNSSFGETDESI